MARLHGSFLIRWWHLDRGGARIQLEHIQSGDRAVTGSLGEALGWIEERVAAESEPGEAGTSEARRRDERGGSAGTKPER